MEQIPSSGIDPISAVLGVASLASGLLGGASAKKAAKRQAARQAAAARRAAAELRERGRVQAAKVEQEIESLRTMRTLDMPGFRQASEIAMRQAQRGGERLARMRMVSRMPGDLRSALYGDNFQAYVSQELGRLQSYAGLTQQIMQASQQQQQVAMQTEMAASQISYEGEQQSIATLGQADAAESQMYGAVGQALGSFASARSASMAQEKASAQALGAQVLMNKDLGPSQLVARRAQYGQLLNGKFSAESLGNFIMTGEY
jgi:hypothetical protein